MSDAGSTLLSFLRRYGYGFDVATQAIAPNREGLVLKVEENDSSLITEQINPM